MNGKTDAISRRNSIALGCAIGMLALAALAAHGGDLAGPPDDSDDFHHGWPIAHARLIATGIPGAGAVAEVGEFLTGSPLHDKAAFAAFTQPGRVLDAKRVLVASTSNFGASPARAGEPEGSILSIDSSGAGLAVPPGFASAGGQAAALGGLVQVYTAQNPSFLNSVTEPQSVTAGLPSASLPSGISINNGNGRPWIANAPYGANGEGTITVLDPQGYPLAAAPDPLAGGVFAGNQTNRNSASTHGLTSAALGTAIITKSPELTGRAVFAALEADGSVVQVNVQKGVDGLAPPGTVSPLARIDRETAESARPRVVSRAGLVLNWVPTLNLFIADPQANRLVVLDLRDNGTLFTATRREVRSPDFNEPIDIAPCTREVSSGSFASNTTLAGGSDLYVLNRGDNSVLRMGIDGKVHGGRRIAAEVPGFRVNGIAVSSDGETLYVTATSPQSDGVLLSIPAFGGREASADLFRQAVNLGQAANMNAFGGFVFNAQLSIKEGLGPFFNDTSCAGCHASPAPGGMGLSAAQAEQLVGRFRSDGSFDDLSGEGGPVARVHSVAELGAACATSAGIPAEASAASLRNAMTLRGDGLIDTIAAGDILANMAGEPASLRGRPNFLADGRMGKFGWKADVPTVVEFVSKAFRNELGVTNPLQPRDETRACGANRDELEVDALIPQAAAKFLNTISPPAPAPACTASPGAAVFQSSGCASCHTPALPGPGARQPVNLYSDLLLHHMGPALADMLPQGSAAGDEWRTMPLWRNAERGKFLHDGRATTVTAAILFHDGQARESRDAFAALDAATQQALISFLGCL
jgi:DNA-binding beta-propeller fold protein YncE/mono/diheme cytochrome c family protein